MTLTEFLLARFAEDESAARDAAEASPDARWLDEDDMPQIGLNISGSLRVVMHIARHDPARVLAECEAKRRIVELMTFVTESWAANHGGEGRSLWPDVNRREREHAQIVLENLALPYADHPDFQEGWRA